MNKSWLERMAVTKKNSLPLQATNLTLSLTQEYILKALNKPRSDQEIIEVYRNLKFAPKVSESGIRTQRANLVRLGLVEDTGTTDLTVYGKKTKVWQRIN
jgi:hypothetical protein